MTQRQLVVYRRIVRTLGSTVAQHIQKALAPLKDQIASIATPRCDGRNGGAALSMLLARVHDERSKLTRTGKFDQPRESAPGSARNALCRRVGSARQYNVGELVTDRGSLHHANRSTRVRPGDGNDWTLVCKRGADGKDLR
jgi:hypothetical protein